MYRRTHFIRRESVVLRETFDKVGVSCTDRHLLRRESVVLTETLRKEGISCTDGDT